ncbi:MAG TPA: CDP-diacylglycerol--glycerol-3-phosphate 3-phosphatidyltransferase [Vineibacter sp.]|nr:CDP-diacylglycerol--glycerol-3-phosphate 3-phosphatidyltransferase [Vineibacter sp.]
MPFNLPNLLTLARIAAIPLVLASMAAGAAGSLDLDWARWIAALLFIAASVTDYFDGWLARRWQLVSRLGRFLDPIADKLLVASVLLLMCAFGWLKSWHIIAAVIILCREIMVSGLREFLAELRVGLPVSSAAKWKTAIQMTALGVLLVGDTGPAWVMPVGLILLWFAAALTLWTGYDYLRAGLAHMIEDPTAMPPPRPIGAPPAPRRDEDRRAGRSVT